jgi:hypothetical protein
MWNILIGIFFIVGGLSGGMALRGTNSSGGLAVIGVLILLYGIFQVARRRGE